MARVESDREDLLREAVALVRRMEIRVVGQEPTITLGFRSMCWLSVYFTADLMYQFDERGRLRRAFVDGLLFRTEGNALAQLRRERSESESTLVRRDLIGQSLADFEKSMNTKIRWLHEAFLKGDAKILRQVPADDVALLDDTVKCLRMILDSPEFLAPKIKA